MHRHDKLCIHVHVMVELFPAFKVFKPVLISLFLHLVFNYHNLQQRERGIIDLKRKKELNF